MSTNPKECITKKKKVPSAITGKTGRKRRLPMVVWSFKWQIYTWTGYLNLHQSFYNPPFCLQTKDRNTDKCCLMILGVYNLRMTSDSPIPQTRKAHQCEVQTALPVTLPHSGLSASSAVTYQTVQAEPAAQTGCSDGWPAFRCAE